MTVEHLSSAGFLDLWTDPLYRAKRRSEAELQINYCGSCCEGPCCCGGVAQLAAEFNDSPVIFMDRGYFCMEET